MTQTEKKPIFSASGPRPNRRASLLRTAKACIGTALTWMLLPGCIHYQAVPLESPHSPAVYDGKSLEAPELRQFVARALGREPSPWPPSHLSYETLSLVAFYFHPQLAVARAQWGVSQGSLKTAEARPNPTLSLQPGYNFSASGGINPWFPGMNLDWPLETAGKRGYRKARATFLAEAARLNVLQAGWSIRVALRSALLDLTAAERRERLLQDQLTSQQRLLQVLEQRFQAGAASRTEVSQVQLASMKSLSDQAEAHRQAVEARGRVAEWSGLPLARLEGLMLELGTSDERPTSDDDFLKMRELALQQRTDLRASLAEYLATESSLQLEVARQYPDLHLGTGYQWDQGDSKWNLGVSLELPLLNRNRGPIAEATARRAEAAARFHALQEKILADLSRAFRQHQAAQSHASRAAALLEAQQQQLARVRSAFERGGADQVELQSAQLEAVSAELVKLEAWIRQQQALGELEQALQTPSPQLEILQAAPSIAPRSALPSPKP